MGPFPLPPGEGAYDEIAWFQFGRQSTGQAARQDRSGIRHSRLKLQLQSLSIATAHYDNNPRPAQDPGLLVQAGRDEDRHMPNATRRVLERLRLR